MSDLINELKRRNVFKVATAYVVVSWLTIQVISSVTEPLSLPAWVPTLIIVLLAVGLPIALIFAWAFEMTPDGVKPTSEVDADASITKSTSRKIDFIIIGALVLIIGGMAFTGEFSSTNGKTETVESGKTVAVLPFVDMSPDKDQDWFSDGLTEEILNSLATLPELRVTARTSSFSFKGQNKPIREIAKKLGVSYVVEGSVRRAGDTLRITAQLIRAEDDYHLWSETYDKSVKDVLDVQSDVAEKIAQALDVVLDDKRRAQMATSGTINVQAFELYLKGKKLATKIHQANQQTTLWEANKLFDAAIALDPTYDIAYYEKMDAYVHFLKDRPNSRYLKGQHSEGLTDEIALNDVFSLLDQSMEMAATPTERLSYELERVAFSDNWTRLPFIINELHKDIDAVARKRVAWTVNILTLVGEHDLASKISTQEIEYDPLSPAAWSEAISNTRHIEGAAASLEKVRQAREKGLDHIWLDEAEVYAYAQLNDKVGLERMLGSSRIRGTTDDVVILAALGRKQEALAANNLLTRDSSFLDGTLWSYYLMGDQAKADALAQQIDSSPLMALTAGSLYDTAGRIPTSPDIMPNLVKRLREAGLAEEKIQAMFLPSSDNDE